MSPTKPAKPVPAVEAVDPYVRAARKHPKVKQQALERLTQRINKRQPELFKPKGKP